MHRYLWVVEYFDKDINGWVPDMSHGVFCTREEARIHCKYIKKNYINKIQIKKYVCEDLEQEGSCGDDTVQKWPYSPNTFTF